MIYNGLGLNFKEASRKLILNFKELYGGPLSIILFNTCYNYVRKENRGEGGRWGNNLQIGGELLAHECFATTCGI